MGEKLLGLGIILHLFPTQILNLEGTELESHINQFGDHIGDQHHIYPLGFSNTTNRVAV